MDGWYPRFIHVGSGYDESGHVDTRRPRASWRIVEMTM